MSLMYYLSMNCATWQEPRAKRRFEQFYKKAYDEIIAKVNTGGV